MKELLFVIIMIVAGFFVGGIFGVVAHAVFFPYAWYGALVGFCISVGVCIGHLDL